MTRLLRLYADYWSHSENEPVERQINLQLQEYFFFSRIGWPLIVILVNRHQFTSFWHLFTTLRWYILAIVVVIQVASYCGEHPLLPVNFKDLRL